MQVIFFPRSRLVKWASTAPTLEIQHVLNNEALVGTLSYGTKPRKVEDIGQVERRAALNLEIAADSSTTWHTSLDQSIAESKAHRRDLKISTKRQSVHSVG